MEFCLACCVLLILIIGTGSGYLTAVVAKLCQSITSVEINEELSGGAKEKLNALNKKCLPLTQYSVGQLAWDTNKRGMVKLANEIPRPTISLWISNDNTYSIGTNGNVQTYTLTSNNSTVNDSL
jgi:16S rRNA A1518/A1519 N6-dimethyltransferase RsmA/KsgA/DIM1 with predicted DNA glycosylase/AP lyase activity